MINRALPALLCLLGACLPLLAQQPAPSGQAEIITREQLEQEGEIDVTPSLSLYRPDLFSSVDSSLLIHSLPVLTLLDGRRFPISSELGRMGMTPLDLFPLAFFSAVEVQSVSPSPIYGTEGPGGVVNLRLNRNYSGGEVGIFYGKSSGRYDREDFQTYIIGSTGNDKFHITAGAAYQESSGHGPRFGR